MNITKTVANIRFKYHKNMFDVCNIANQLGLLKDTKAIKIYKNHCMKAIECVEQMVKYDLKMSKKIES